jgi:hypothetical protein
MDPVVQRDDNLPVFKLAFLGSSYGSRKNRTICPLTRRQTAHRQADSVSRYSTYEGVMSRTLLSEVEEQQLLEQLAYQSWLSRGCPVGSPEVDWHHAVNILNTQLTRVDSEQSRSDGSAQQLSNRHSSYNELGNDEDTPTDSVSLSPFAAQSTSSGLTRSELDVADSADGAGTSAKPAGETKRGSRGRKRE